MNWHRSASIICAVLTLLCTGNGVAQAQNPQTLPASEPAIEGTDTPAEPLVLRIESRARYEFADSAASGPTGEALTIRVRPSLELALGPKISLLGEVEAIASLLPDRRNGFLSGQDRPAIADGEAFELNRLQLDWAPNERFRLTLGRQRISIDDERFIGTVDFRQNQQTYDAVAVVWQLPHRAVLQAGHIWRVGRVLGPDHPGGVFDSASFYTKVTVPTRIGGLGLYHYHLDLDDRIGRPSQQRTTGIEWRGRAFKRHDLGDFGVFGEIAYARQENGRSTPDFLRIAGTIERGDLTLALRHERLGSDRGIAFQTPLATLHRFQGMADLFLVTPPQGVSDTEMRAIWRFGSWGPARGTSVTLQYNHFDPATGQGRLGEEWGGEFGLTLFNTRLSFAATHYRAKNFGADSRRVWITAERNF